LPAFDNIAMARKLVFIILVVLLLVWGGYRYFRHRQDLELAAQWLSRDCTVTDQVLFERAIRERGAALEPLFIEAFSNGPPRSEMDKILASIDAFDSRRQEKIRAGQTNYQRTEDGLSLAEEKQHAQADFDHGYRAAALNGLRIIGRPAGRQFLQGLSAQESASPYQYLARLLLQR